MRNTIEAFSKQFFGAKYEGARKSLLAAVILFIAVHATEFQVAIAPFVLYLTSTFFPAGVMWQVLTGRQHMETMQGMFMLPFDNRGFVFAYVLVLGAHTLIKNAADLGAVLRRRLMERGGNCDCGFMRLYGVCSDGGGVSDVQEGPCCATNPLGRRYFGHYFAGALVGGGAGYGNH